MVGGPLRFRVALEPHAQAGDGESGPGSLPTPRTARIRPFTLLLSLLILLTNLSSSAWTGSPSAPRGLSFRDDFDYSPSWRVVEGTWRYHDGVINGSGADARIVAGSGEWLDIHITGRLRLVSGGEAGVLFRVNSASHGLNNGRYYQASFSGKGTARLSRVAMGEVALKSAPCNFSAGDWHDFGVRVCGTAMELLLDGEPVLNHTNLELMQGRVGLGARGSTAEFDNIVVRDAVTGAILLSDNFSSSPCGGWDPHEGTWDIADGECGLISEGAGLDRILAPVEAPGSNWTLRTRMIWSAGSNFESGVLFGFNGPGDHYLVLLSARDQTFRVRRTEGGAVNANWLVKPFPVAKNEWYTLTVLWNGSGFEFYVNSAQVASKTEPYPLPGKGLGLGSCSNSEERVRFSFFEVIEGLSPPMPDLSINLSTLEIYPTRPNPGDDVTFKFGVDNSGTMDAAGGILVEVLADEIRLAVAVESNIPAGRTYLVFLHWVANLTGNLSLLFVVDRFNQIDELDEDNNNASAFLTVNTPPVASFTMVPEDGRARIAEEVRFNASASHDPDGRIASYHWSFGDGTGASVPVVGHRYQREGSYKAVLTVTDSDGASASASARVYISKRDPSADFTWNPPTGNVSTVFIFRYRIQDPDNTMSGWLWDLGDGLSTTDQAPSHRYSDDGVYTVTLTVFFNQGRNSTSVRKELIVENTPPCATILSAPSDLLKREEGIFRACATDLDDPPELLGFLWCFGDGVSATGPEVSHCYTRSGTYRVSLTVSDDDGDNSTLYHTVRVPNLPPEALFACPPPGYLNETFTFDATFSWDPDGSIVNWSWEFGDGTRGYGAVVSHGYSTPGNYTVTLTVTDDEGATNSSSAVLWVREMPTPPPVSLPISPGTTWTTVALVAALVGLVMLALVVWASLRRRGGGEGGAGEEQGPGGVQG
ncbi:MAG: PKD domain-containing protein [Thermoplasmata archaeon]